MDVIDCKRWFLVDVWGLCLNGELPRRLAGGEQLTLLAIFDLRASSVGAVNCEVRFRNGNGEVLLAGDLYRRKVFLLMALVAGWHMSPNRLLDLATKEG